MPNYGPNQTLNLNTSFERSLSKLSENMKIVKLELKLMAVETVYGISHK